MGGNIGTAVLALEPPGPGRCHVIEMSSFQIELTPMLGPGVGALLNITPDHLDRYSSFDAYRRSKFRIFCGACHGVGGYGGSVVAANMTERRPPSLRTPVMAALPDQLIYTVIVNGFGRMPPYAAQLTERERWAVIAWLRQLQRTPAAAPDERVDSVRGALIRAQDSVRAARPQGTPP